VTLEAHPDGRLRERARALRRTLRAALPLAVASRLFFWGHGFRSRWRAMVRGAWQVEPTVLLASLAVAPFLGLTLALFHVAAQARYWLLPGGDQPQTVRVEYGPARVGEGAGAPRMVE